VRLRGRDEIGLALVDVLRRYARELEKHDARLFVITSSDRVMA